MSTFVYRKTKHLARPPRHLLPAGLTLPAQIGRGLSYYPTRGTTFVDGDDRARSRTGLSGLG